MRKSIMLGLLLLLVLSQSSLFAAGAGERSSVEELESQLALLEKDAHYWQQLTALLQPVEMPTMTDHRAYMLPSGVLFALHFDNMDLDQAENLNWVALGVPGKYWESDRLRIEETFGEGFIHFHDLANDTHGGEPGTEGVWFVHVAVREFDAPWGRVTPGIDHNFMPTPAPTQTSVSSAAR